MAAQVKQPVVAPPLPPLRHQQPFPTIAMQVLQIGWQDGVLLKRTGVARMPARVVHQQLEVVHEPRSWSFGAVSLSGGDKDTGACAIFGGPGCLLFVYRKLGWQ